MTTVTPELSEQIYAYLETYYQIAEQKLNRRFVRPDITFNQRGKAAGSARLQQNHIKLNPILLNENSEHFLQQVIPHEISHLLVFQLFGRVKPHGREWQHMMQSIFGLEPLVQHTLDVSKVSGKQFDYQCLCGPIKLSIRRHNSIVRKRRVYCCRKCNSVLKPMASESAI